MTYVSPFYRPDPEQDSGSVRVTRMTYVPQYDQTVSEGGSSSGSEEYSDCLDSPPRSPCSSNTELSDSGQNSLMDSSLAIGPLRLTKSKNPSMEISYSRPGDTQDGTRSCVTKTHPQSRFSSLSTDSIKVYADFDPYTPTSASRQPSADHDVSDANSLADAFSEIDSGKFPRSLNRFRSDRDSATSTQSPGRRSSMLSSVLSSVSDSPESFYRSDSHDQSSVTGHLISGPIHEPTHDESARTSAIKQWQSTHYDAPYTSTQEREGRFSISFSGSRFSDSDSGDRTSSVSTKRSTAFKAWRRQQRVANSQLGSIIASGSVDPLVRTYSTCSTKTSNAYRSARKKTRIFTQEVTDDLDSIYESTASACSSGLTKAFSLPSRLSGAVASEYREASTKLSHRLYAARESARWGYHRRTERVQRAFSRANSSAVSRYCRATGARPRYSTGSHSGEISVGLEQDYYT